MKRADELFKGERERKFECSTNLSRIDIGHAEAKINFDDRQVDCLAVGGQNATIHLLSSDQMTSYLSFFIFFIVRFALRCPFTRSPQGILSIRVLTT